MYKSTKKFGHELGLSACFRQHKADSHCRYLHGYALAIKVVFCADELDEKNWVVNFGGLKGFKQQLVDLFDHKLLVAKDDPELELLKQLHSKGVADIVVVDKTGCEAFAKLVYDLAAAWLNAEGLSPRCYVESVEVSEHGANSAIYTHNICHADSKKEG